MEPLFQCALTFEVANKTHGYYRVLLSMALPALISLDSFLLRGLLWIEDADTIVNQ